MELEIDNATASAPRRLKAALLAAACIALAWALVPAADGIRLFGWRLPDLCPAAALGGRCAGCGLSRSLLAILHGDFTLAWSLSPGGFALILLGLLPVLRRHLGEQGARKGREGVALLLVALTMARVLEVL